MDPAPALPPPPLLLLLEGPLTFDDLSGMGLHFQSWNCFQCSESRPSVRVNLHKLRYWGQTTLDAPPPIHTVPAFLPTQITLTTHAHTIAWTSQEQATWGQIMSIELVSWRVLIFKGFLDVTLPLKSVDKKLYIVHNFLFFYFLLEPSGDVFTMIKNGILWRLYFIFLRLPSTNLTDAHMKIIWWLLTVVACMQREVPSILHTVSFSLDTTYHLWNWSSFIVKFLYSTRGISITNCVICAPHCASQVPLPSYCWHNFNV